MRALWYYIIMSVVDLVRAEVAAQLKVNSQNQLSAIKEILSEMVRREVAAAMTTQPRANNELVVRDEQALAVRLEKSVAGRVMLEVDKKIMPMISHLAESIKYNATDTSDVVDSYRRAVAKADAPLSAIEYGKKDKRVITEHVRTFFEDWSDSEDGGKQDQYFRG
jgi:hypothetical protein